MSDNLKSIDELQQYADSQYLTIQTCQARIKELEIEIDHLKKLLATTPITDNKTIAIITSSEQTICEMEIERLKQASFERGLTLEETKRLDLLVKNLYLSKDQKKDINAQFRAVDQISEAQLLHIASFPVPKIDDAP